MRFEPDWAVARHQFDEKVVKLDFSFSRADEKVVRPREFVSRGVTDSVAQQLRRVQSKHRSAAHAEVKMSFESQPLFKSH